MFRRQRTPWVLCADDDEGVRALCSAALIRAGYQVDFAINGREALDKLRMYRYSAVLLDLDLPLLHGATLLSLLHRDEPELLRRIIVVTGLSGAGLVDVQPLVGSILHKPVSIEAMVAAVRDCTSRDETIATRDLAASSSAAR